MNHQTISTISNYLYYFHLNEPSKEVDGRGKLVTRLAPLSLHVGDALRQKGWLAIAKLKSLSLFISLLLMLKKAFDNIFKTVRIFPDDCQFFGFFQNCLDFSR